jgi:hypothetical protein
MTDDRGLRTEVLSRLRRELDMLCRAATQNNLSSEP